ncbi:unnamed protein product [Kuraishia capsulata CBS 1993]|uniref:Uncharacterized protein n=1 Tax=Kuraishia capsulata CBS 1993 TaxID=1382522 RepID=W6MFQ0_9ASCO|nr:uncharacterized protein KUCA_T00000670001 [Kuraishia capsulata CBS 1993]CDK24704.1 unnamed protein product [Kuraishia capsulata CBS 1993]
MLQAQFTSLLNANNFIPLPETDVLSSEIDGSFTAPKQETLFALIHQLYSLITAESQSTTSDELKKIHRKKNLSFLKIASYCRAILLSPTLDDNYELTHILKIWEIRILCLLFLTDPSFSKNPVTHTIIPNAKFLRTEVNILMKELIRIEESRLRRENSPIDKRPVEMRFPEELDPFFKEILRRIKYGPSLVLINYSYMDLFELRGFLAESTDEMETNDYLKRIEILAYATTATMIARRENLSVFNLLIATAEDAERCTVRNELYISRLSLLGCLIGLIYLFKEYSSSTKPVVSAISGEEDHGFEDSCDESPYFASVKNLFSKVQLEGPFVQLAKIMGSVPPVFDDESFQTVHLESGELRSLVELQRLIKNLKITGRILCSLCAEFELTLRFGESSEILENSNDELSSALQILNKVWWNGNVSKVYGFE